MRTVRDRTILALLLFFMVPGALPARAQPAPLGGLDAYIEQAMHEWEVPGLAIAVVKEDSVVFAKGYGVREVGQPGRVDEQTLFAIASTTKAFTAAALGMLVDEERIDWDDPVTDYLPGFQLHDPYVTGELTVRDLLTHRSGLARGDRLWLSSEYDRDEILRRVRYLEPSWSFRSRYGYQNLMFIAAGEVVAAAAGTSWDDFIQRRIFRPLGMARSNTSIIAQQDADNVATPHTRLDGEVRPIAWHNYDNLGGAGSINSNVVEMAQWVRLHLNEGTYKGQRLLSPEVVSEMHTPQTVIHASEDTEELYPETHFRAYGLGWFLQDYRGEKIVHHSGYVNNMRTQVGMIPELDLGIVAITNLSDSNLQAALMYRVFDAYLGGRPPRDWSADLLAARAEDRTEAEARRDSVENARVPDTRPSLELGGYEGVYVDSLYGDASVTQDNDGLVLHLGPEYTGDLEHWHYNTFRAVWRDPFLGRTFVTFTLNAAGEADAMNVDGLAEFSRTGETESTAER